ncbi:hypothetical protein FISHEDRAFT_50671, partial [Fistulina hepatica ATCC 64428]
KAYMFEFELLGSSSPVIKRTVDVPSWYTFQELHYVIQYAFGPWQLCHLHEFNFTLSKPNRSGKISLGMQRDVLKLLDRHDAEEAEELITNARVELEDRVYLKDVFDPHGRLHNVVTRNGSILPLIYLYDFGDNWEHLITFKGEKLAVAARPLFSSAVGYGPAEDAGGVTGWQDVKAAFAASNPTRKQLEIRKWATEQMGMVGRDDPLAVEGGPYSPLKTPNVTVMNYDGRWVNHLEGKAYTFTIELLDSRDPVISRTVEVPAWYTFEKLHYIIQYGFSWRQSHMHEFTFPDLVPDPEDDDVLISKGTALEIKNSLSLEFPDDFENPPEWPMAYEHHTKLSDVYDPDGKFYKVVWRDGTFFLPLMYTYDFGDNWEHDITHVSEGPVLVDRPIFSEATGKADDRKQPQAFVVSCPFHIQVMVPWMILGVSKDGKRLRKRSKCKGRQSRSGSSAPGPLSSWALKRVKRIRLPLKLVHIIHTTLQVSTF